MFRRESLRAKYTASSRESRPAGTLRGREMSDGQSRVHSSMMMATSVVSSRGAGPGRGEAGETTESAG